MPQQSLHERIVALRHGTSKPKPQHAHTAKTHKPKPPADASALDYALRYAAAGIRAIWIPARSKAPKMKGWPELATTDAATIKRWAAEHPGCNFGLVMGNGFVAIDFDAGADFAALKAEGLELPPTCLDRTPGGGFHFIYHVPDGVTIKNAVGVRPGVDVRGARGQIVAPGSVHPNGGIYTLDEDLPIAPLPAPWLALLTQPPQQRAQRTTRGLVTEGGRNAHLAKVAGALHARGLALSELKAQLLIVNGEQCNPPLSEAEVLTIATSVDKYPVPPNVTALLNDAERPRVLLPGDNRLLSDVGVELGAHLRGLLYRHGRDVVLVEDCALRAIGTQELRTLVEQRVICCRVRSIRGGAVDVGVTMTGEEARGVLASPQFLAALDPLTTVATCRTPIMRTDGHVELLPEGYDADTQTMTISSVEFADAMPFADAVTVVRDLFGEFEFADAGRSLAVALSALISLYAQQLLPAGALRPVFVYSKNAEGSGATTAAACAMVPVLGSMPTGAKPDDDAELRKLLTSAVREGRRVVLLDNVKNTIGGGPLEAFTSAATWSDRVLGANELVQLENNLTVFATANGATLTPDMRRRSLVCELHLSVERAEDRQFKRPLNVAVLRSLRPQILAAGWSLVKHWDMQGRPQPNRSHSAFPEWAAVIGGIVESAGFGCALDTPETLFAPDEDGNSMRVLVAAMKPGRSYDAAQLYALCRAAQIFTTLVGLHEGDMGKAQLSTMGRLLARYHNRIVGKSRFLITGTGHGRRFVVQNGKTNQHGRMVEHGVSVELLKTNDFVLRVKHHADHADHADKIAEVYAAERSGKAPKFARSAAAGRLN